MRPAWKQNSATFNGADKHKSTTIPQSAQVNIEELQRHVGNMASIAEQLPPPKAKPDTLPDANSIDYAALLNKARVKPTDVIDKPVGCWAIGHQENQVTVGTLGNLSTITGKAKTKKTFAVTIAVAAVVTSKVILNRITGLLEPNGLVLFFDTEQSRYHVLRIVKRICRLTGVDNPDNLIVYSLRPYSPQERLKTIDWALQNTPGISMVVIDGVRDLAIDPITDPEDASDVMTHLLKWTDELNIHIMVVLHQNKTDSNVRGHLGTELVNKSETVLSISRDSDNKEVSIVSPEFCRDREFEEFRFSVDETGLPFLVDEGSVSSERVSGIKKKAKPTVDTMTPADIDAIINRAFGSVELLGYSQLRTNVIEASEFAGLSLSKSRAEAFIQRVVLQGLVLKFKPDKGKHDAYRLPVSADLNHPS